MKYQHVLIFTILIYRVEVCGLAAISWAAIRFIDNVVLIEVCVSHERLLTFTADILSLVLQHFQHSASDQCAYNIIEH